MLPSSSIVGSRSIRLSPVVGSGTWSGDGRPIGVPRRSDRCWIDTLRHVGHCLFKGPAPWTDAVEIPRSVNRNQCMIVVIVWIRHDRFVLTR